MNIILSPDQETTDALAERVGLFNSGSGAKPISQEQFLTAELNSYLAGLVTAKRGQTVEQIKTATDLLPYEKRVELAQINRDFIEEALARQ
jgi:hypothetical protein